MTFDRVSQFEREDRITGEDSLFSLHDVVERRVSVHWDEAVAIVEEVCHLAMASAGETAPVPDLENVLIGRDGHVTLGRARGDKSPTAAGRMLHSLLSNGAVPMPLRLFVTQSTGHDTYQSLREFARGLAYFGKPGREQLIRDVYERCAQSGRHTARVPSEPPPLPTRENEPASESARQQKAKRKSIKRWVCAAAALAAAGGAAWPWTSGPPAHDVRVSAARVLSNAADALANLGQQARNTMSPPTAAPAVAAAESVETFGRSKSKRGPSSSSGETSAVEPAPPISRQLSPSKSAGAWQFSATVPNAVGFEPAAGYQQPTEPAAEQAVLYSSADLSVEPPALIFPQVTPPPERSGGSGATVNRMVVVVSPEGTVERVQLVEGPARMVDMMLLSGAKTWRFAPALKDGEPVRYRIVVSWTAVP